MYQKHTLSNGLRVITVPRPDTEAVSVLVLVGVGSRYETRQTNGVAHFVEHMMFKGTKRRPNTFVLSRELDRYGADYNAYTSKDHTGYYIKIASENLELALDMLSDMLLHSKFDPVEFDRERGVILEEIKMYNDNPLMLAPELFERVLFGEDHQLGWSIAGPAEVISKVPRSALTHFVSNHYIPKTTVVAVAGNFNGLSEDTLVKKVGSYFRFVSSSSGGRHAAFRPFTAFPKKSRLLMHHKDTEQVQLMLGTPGFSYRQEDRFPLSLLSIVLGGNMSSRLFIRVRERRGLAYFIRAETDSYQDTGSFAIRAGVDPTKMDESLKAIMKELRLVVEKGITSRELADAKLFLRGKMLLGLEDSSALAEWFGRQEVLTNKIVTPHERLEELERVKNSDIQRVAKMLFQTSKLYLSVIGPFEQTEGAQFMKLINL